MAECGGKASDFQRLRAWIAVSSTPETRRGGGAPGAEAVGFDAIWGNVGEMKDGGGGAVQFKGDVTRGDVVGSIGGVVVAVERAGGSCVVLAKVLNMMMSGPSTGQRRQSPERPCPSASPWVVFF